MVGTILSAVNLGSVVPGDDASWQTYMDMSVRHLAPAANEQAASTRGRPRWRIDTNPARASAAARPVVGPSWSPSSRGSTTPAWATVPAPPTFTDRLFDHATTMTTGPMHDARFGVRALLLRLALTLVAVTFGLLLFLVQDKWRPLLRADQGRARICTALRCTTADSSPR